MRNKKDQQHGDTFILYEIKLGNVMEKGEDRIIAFSSARSPEKKQ